MAEEIYQTEIPELNMGQTLKRLRENAGYTMDTFGGMMGWNKSTVSKVESGSRGISAEELYRAATILGIPISNFYPEVITEDWDDETPAISNYADDIREMACALEESKGKVTPDIEEKAKEVFLRSIPQCLYKVLNVSPNDVSIKGTLMRGPHFIPRVEIHYTGRRGYDLDWFYIVISFKDGLKHIFMSLVQNTDVRFRADCDPIDQNVQLDLIKQYCEDIAFDKLSTFEQDWIGRKRPFEIFLDEGGFPPESGAVEAFGYVPVTPPEEYDVTVNDRVYPDMIPFVISNVDGRSACQGDSIPTQIVNTLHENQELFSEEYRLMTGMDGDIKTLFEHLGYIIESVETGAFVRWKKEVLGNASEYRIRNAVNLIPALAPVETAYGEIPLAKKVLEAHDYKCEVDGTHESFPDKKTGKPYMEVSHLIPLFAQPDFKKDLNRESNMICVCPLCNRKLVRGGGSMIEDMIVPLYYSRRDALKKDGIEITLKQLLEYYGA